MKCEPSISKKLENGHTIKNSYGKEQMKLCYQVFKHPGFLNFWSEWPSNIGKEREIYKQFKVRFLISHNSILRA